MFGFELDEGENSQIITTIDDVKNIEGSHSIAYKKVKLINVNDIASFKSAIESSSKTYDNHGCICVLDEQKTIVARTFISNIRIIKSKHNNVTFIGHVWQHPKGFQKALDMKINNQITEKNVWKTFKKDELQGWLVWALNSKNNDTPKANITVRIDGNEFHNLDSFFCTLGEEIHGPGGYFGRNLYAVYDCLRGGFGVESVSELIWINHQKSKKLLKSKFNAIIETFEDFNVKITLK
ncbi:MAG: barstar family protein [Chryseobacterium jejuense]|uniref:barstar family protein n=1 Tax=Chryseobacterium jejuense TaxID=445960 RepID=UPI003D105D4F